MIDSHNMQDSSELFTRFNEKYAKIRNLISSKKNQDPENEPYKSQYEARKLLKEIEKDLLPLLTADEHKSAAKDRLAVVYNHLANICYDVDEPSQGDIYSKKALQLLSSEPICPKHIICYISTLNQIGFADCKYNKVDSSVEHLEKAESAYHSFKKNYTRACDIGALFNYEEPDELNRLENCHTLTLFYLAQVYSLKGLRFKSAKYCHTTLQRQLELKTFDAVDWALNSATLSQYLIEIGAFKEARTHLAAAQYMLEKHKVELDKTNEETEDLKAQKESLRHRRADVFRCWAKYGLYLLNTSRTRLMTSEGDKVDPPPKPPEELEGLCFHLEDDIRDLEDCVTCEPILTFEDAKPVFLKSQEWLNVAKEFYTLEDHASDHVSILQDSSQLYLALAFFQQDEAMQCKLHKRRIDLLEKAVNALNPCYYLKVCRELWYELGETCHTMADLKHSQADVSGNNHFLSKTQHYFKEGIKYFEKYLGTFKLEIADGKVERFPEEYEENIIEGLLYLARMYTKLTFQDKAELLKSQKESLRNYQTVLNYCSAHPEKEKFATEIGICREMVTLIPLKLMKIDRLM